MSAIFSPCRTWRYQLKRDINFSRKTFASIGVNPSVAAETVNDPTIRKDIGFGERWGYGAVLKGNLFAFCSTDIKGLRTAADPIGPDNDLHLEAIIAEADMVLVGWGTNVKLPKHLRNRWCDFVLMADKQKKPLYCLSTTDDGHPRHPLFVSYDTPLELWRPPK